jgi:TATA-box binding protein (TBP) (component of TFIID and TFIIIB)
MIVQPKRKNKFPPGVTFKTKANKYTAKAFRNGKHIYIGSYDTVEEAAQAYQDFIKANPPERSGQKASLSFSKRKPKNDFKGTWLYGL